MAGITRGTSTLLSASLLAILLGCVESGRRDESDPGRRSATGDRLRLSEEARANLGLVTSPVQSQVIQDTVETTGWLAVIPGKEVTVKAAATGFVVSDAGEKSIEPGTLVTAGQRLATWHMFLSPQEEAQLVAIKENVDILDAAVEGHLGDRRGSVPPTPGAEREWYGFGEGERVGQGDNGSV